ncbi:hypothetical protein [Streptacidiphilus sp. P02-A3a]|uniref:hypothetical protein n=1 Tax=Streptacidiphilus sp. P02-A3a TaxID=2704468 RepID=UPI0015F8FE74|nr:hypothetical protein [Streptacidiphilus sp. P02-A3a]QMU71982.1 hypothetical protein GXP74_30870 [Streptacidiphilus sp. P02-A3a]
MIEVGRHGAFSVNCVGLRRLPFPLSFSVREADGSWMISAAAARAGELVDVLTRTANDTVVVVNLATNSFLDGDYQQWRPSLIAAELGVDCAVHPVGAWASDSIALGEEFLVMRRDSLPGFLTGEWSPYELSLVDVPAGVTPEQLDELALVIGTGTGDEPLLARLDGSRFRYSGHDDCYLLVESTDPAAPAAVLGRLLALLAGSVLIGAGGAASVRVPEPDSALPERLIGESPHWVGVVGTASGTTVTVTLSALPRRWRLGQAPPERADHVATLDLAHGGWRLAPAESAG